MGPSSGIPPPTAASNRSGAPGLAGQALELRAVVGDHVLVRGHDALARGQGGADERAGRLVAAHRLDDDVHVAARDHVRRGVRQQRLRDAGGDGPLGELLRDRGQHQRAPVGGRQARRPVEEGAHDLAADGAGADDADAQGLNAHGGVSQLGAVNVGAMVANVANRHARATGVRWFHRAVPSRYTPRR